MRFLIVFATLAWWSSIEAHLHTPWLTQGEALRQGSHLVLVRVKGVGRKVGDGTETSVEVLATLAGTPLPGGLVDVWQAGPHRHALEPEALVFLPLVATPAGGWQYLAESRQPLRTKATHRDLDERFAQAWRRDPPLDPLEHPDAWLGLLAHPAPLARSMAFETLTARGPLLRPLMTPERLEQVLAPALAPGAAEGERLTRLRLIEVLGGRAGAEAVAQRFERLPGERVRSAAAGLLARYPTPLTRAVLAACAARGGGLGARCTRLSAAPTSAP